MNSALYNELITALSESVEEKRAFVGLDGFVDEVVAVVDKRFDATNYSRMKTIADYARRILEGSGLSLNVESVVLETKMGGNGTIYAAGLKRFGMKLFYVGAVGADTTHPVFEELKDADGLNVIGVAEPARTDAIEFQDGKIISTKQQTLNELKWEDIISRVSIERIAREIDASDVLSLNSWSMIPAMTSIWDHFMTDVLPLCKAPLGGKTAFFDLADPRKRDEKDLREALGRVRGFREAGFRAMLGLNLKEARQVGETLGCAGADDDLETLTKGIARRMKIDCVAVHPVDRAACFQNGEYFEVPGPFCESPLRTTGAGDLFNAGFVYGQARGWKSELCLLMGVMSSGFFVKNGKYADKADIEAFCARSV